MKKVIIFLCFFISLLAGCSVVPFVQGPIVTGIVMWKQGEAHKYYRENLKTMYRSTKNALKELNCKIISDQTVRDGYKIVAGDKDKFKIYIREAKPHICDVCVRINLMGDKPYAELFYTQIDANTNVINYDEKGIPTKLTTKFQKLGED